ncbi:MAG TPA: DoxX family protein [Herpetosiphonaceae bacterium]
MFRRLSSYENLAPLLLRLGIGLTFFFAGLGKVLGGTAGVAGFFGSLGIPLAGLMGPFVAYLELIGGLALILGVFTRGFGLLFAADMLVALLLVGLPKAFAAENIAVGFTDARVEVLLLLGSVALALLGAGAFSIDEAFLGDRPRQIAERPAPHATR